jgi:hypothetical protein
MRICAIEWMDLHELVRDEAKQLYSDLSTEVFTHLKLVFLDQIFLSGDPILIATTECLYIR